MRIGAATNFARLSVAETITALWTFANAAGLLTDDIGERTPGAGVTIDGLELIDQSIRALTQPAAGSITLGAQVLGDTDLRFFLETGGRMLWGPGDAGVDTIMRRVATGELQCDHDFNVAMVLDLAGDIEYAARSPATITSDQDDYDTGTVPVQRLGTDASRTITGFAGGRNGRLIHVLNIGSLDLVLSHQDVGSAAANRMILPNAVNLTLTDSESIMLFYDSVSSRWRTLANAV